MRRNLSGKLGIYKYLWPGSVYLSHNEDNLQKLCEIIGMMKTTFKEVIIPEKLVH